MPRKPKQPATAKDKEKKETSLTPAFKAVFITVTIITVLCLIGFVALAIIYPNDDPTSRLTSVFETLRSAFTLGFGAIVGLLGGKAL